MSACPCVRLRLWRQQGLDWRRRLAMSTASSASAGGALGGRRGLSQAACVAEKRHVPAVRIIRGGGQTAPWTSTDTSTEAPPRDRDAAGRGPRGSRPPRPSRPSRPSRPPREPRRTAKGAGVHVLGQQKYLRRTCAPDDYRRAQAAFWAWKKALADTWAMVEAGQLPCGEAENDMLRRLLGARPDEAHGSSSDTTATTAPTTTADIRRAWQALPRERRRDAWPGLMMATLRARPDRAADLFAATFDAALVPSYVAEDTLHHLARQGVSDRRPAVVVVGAAALLALVQRVLDDGPADYLRLQQSTIYFVLRAIDAAAAVDGPALVARLHALLVRHRHPLHSNTLLQIAGRLAASPAHKVQAVAVLQTMRAESDFDINSVQGAALCTAILSTGQPDGATDGRRGGAGGAGGGGAATVAAAAAAAAASSTSSASPSPALSSPTATPSPAASAASADAPTPAEMFAELLRCGLEPNLITYTTIVRGLCQKHELDAAREVLQLMAHSGTEPDAYVYSTMMNGAKLCGDLHTLRHVVESAVAARVRHPYVWNDFLQAVYAAAFAEARHALKRPRVVPSLPLMLHAYAKLFVPAPLRTVLPEVGRLLRADADADADAAVVAAASLGRCALDADAVVLPPPPSPLPPPPPPSSSSPSAAGAAAGLSGRRWEFWAALAPVVDDLPSLPPAERIEPTSMTLVTMILAYVQGLSSPYDVIAFYSHFRRLLQAENPTALRLVRDHGTRVHDIVVMALCEFEGMLRVALDVVGDMLRDASATLEPSPSPSPSPSSTSAATSTHPVLGHPPPSVYTWSILLNGFMFHRQTRQGERILRIMTERGVRPNRVTWNTLMAGFARAQNVRKTAAALQRLERAGFEPDDFTLRAFSYLADKAAVLRYLEAQQDKARAAADAAAAQDTAPVAEPTTSAHQPETHAAYDGADTDSARSVVAHELRSLESEVGEIAKMMDEEQQQRAGRRAR